MNCKKLAVLSYEVFLNSYIEIPVLIPISFSLSMSAFTVGLVLVSTSNLLGEWVFVHVHPIKVSTYNFLLPNSM